MPQVSVVMPAFRLTSRVNGQGVPYVRELVDDVLSQTFRDFEWIILDNKSDDETIHLLESLLGREVRVKVIEDSQRRLPEQAIRRLVDLVESPFCLIINDDDRFKPNYISKLMEEHGRLRDAHVTYSQARYIAPNGSELGSVIRSEDELYGLGEDSEADLARYLYFRNPVPVTFGIWEREFLDEAYPREVIDEYHANIDNLFLLKCILARMRAGYVSESLFSYRQRPRSWNLDDSFPSHGGSADAFTVATRMMLHQTRFAELLLAEASKPSTLVDQRRTFSLIAASLQYASFQAIKWSIALYPLNKDDFAKARPLVAAFLRPRRRHWKSWGKQPFDQSVGELVAFHNRVKSLTSSAREGDVCDELDLALGRVLDSAARY